jgi:integrase
MSHKFKKNRFMNVVFSMRKDQKSKNGLALLYWYLSFDGQRSKKYSSGIRVQLKDWNRNHAIGINAKPINDAIGDIKADLTYTFNTYKDSIVNVQEIADIYNNNENTATVLLLFDDLVKRKSSENWSVGTVKTYKSFRKQWLLPYCNSISKPFYANTFRPKHLEELATTMRLECGEEFIRKSLSKVKAAFNLGFAMEKISANPISTYRLFYSEKKHKNYVYLTPDEIESLEKLTFSEKETHLELARDLFLIQCYTSLSFNELKEFDVNEHYIEGDNWEWILQKRGKTDVFQQIPLLPKAIKLLQKLKFILMPSVNHRYNEYIRICAYRAGIDKHLHSHIGRISCGAYLLNSGISLEVVSRVLGHTNINQTERVYARILDNWRVKDEFTKVFRSEPKEQEHHEPKTNEPQKMVSTGTNQNFTYFYTK